MDPQSTSSESSEADVSASTQNAQAKAVRSQTIAYATTIGDEGRSSSSVIVTNAARAKTIRSGTGTWESTVSRAA